MRLLLVVIPIAVALGLPFAATSAVEKDASQESRRQADPKRQRPQQQSAQQAAPQDEAEARKKLEAEIAKQLGATPGAAAGATAQPQPPTPAQGGSSPYARLLLLPDLSAIGSFAAAYDSYDVESQSPRPELFGPKDRPSLMFQELELGIQSVVDPYARADIFVSFTPEGVDLEEAYLTTLSLPAGFQVRAGKLFSPFGRQNQQHPHVQDFVDPPLAQSRILATDAFSGAGLDMAWLAPLPWFAELHLAAQNTGELPPAVPGAPEEGTRLTGIARLVQFFSLGEATTIGVGVSAARREDAGAGAFRDLGGVDLFVKHRPPATRAYATLAAELYARRFRGIPDAAGTDTGGWAQAFFRKSAYYGYGVRYDFAPSAAGGISGTDQRFGVVAAWFPSEFQRIRAQVSYERLPDGKDGVEALLHLEFGIGAHGAHPF